MLKDDSLNPILMSLAKGRLVVGLVREFLEWCNLEFTLKVFEPEIGKDVGGSSNRSSLLRQLVSPSEGAKSAAGPAHTYLSFPLHPLHPESTLSLSGPAWLLRCPRPSVPPERWEPGHRGHGQRRGSILPELGR